MYLPNQKCTTTWCLLNEHGFFYLLRVVTVLYCLKFERKCWLLQYNDYIKFRLLKAVKRMFKTDQPIESWRDDVLGRASFAQASGEVILSYKEKDSIVR